MGDFSATADGSRLVFESSTDESHVYVARLEDNGKLGNTRRLTLDERYNLPWGWTPDSKAVIFSSDRTGNYSIYKQALDQNVPELIPTGPESARMARVSPDGTRLIFAALSNVEVPDQSASIRLMRVPLAGGPPQFVLESKAAFLDFDCPHRSGLQCVMSERVSDAKETVFSSFDPASGTRHELFRTRKQSNWILSPDGSRIAIAGTDPQGRIEIRSLTGQIQTRIEMGQWSNPPTVDWVADGKALFVSHPGLIQSPSGPIGVTLLRVDVEGQAQPLWETRAGRITWTIASPDGKYLAIREPATERNAWMVENF